MLSETLKQQIQAAYSTLLQSRGLKPRLGQKQMIAEIARTLGEIELDDNGERCSGPAICVVEAGTGTGKTIAYTLAALPLARELGKKLVVASATVALQEQIVLRDYPDLCQQGALDFSFSLAKGRGRYMCLAKLDKLLAAPADQALAFELYAEGALDLLSQDAISTYQALLAAMADGSWAGDRDSWSETIADEIWRPVTTDHAQCTGRRCPHVSRCPYFVARETMESADCIVTNHDLVLADIALGGGAILPPPEQCIYVFDEGHQLPDKAISHFAQRQRLGATQGWLEQLSKACRGLLDELTGEVALLAQVNELLELIEQTQESLGIVRLIAQQLLADHGRPSDEADNSLRYRFVNGAVPLQLQQPARDLAGQFSKIAAITSKLATVFEQVLAGQSHLCFSQADAELWYPVMGAASSRAEANQTLWQRYYQTDAAGQPPQARWLTQYQHANGSELEVAATPIVASGLLAEALWPRSCGVIITSATLAALGSFQRFIDRSGVPVESRFAVVPSPFDHYQAGLLRVVDLGADPGVQRAHSEAIIEAMPRLCETGTGLLVLFSSRRQMRTVYDGLAEPLRRKVLMQDQLPKHELIRQHLAAIDSGEQSIIFGLASFAEGIDLPGDYCDHLIIAKVPFAVPDDPVEATLSEWVKANGGNPFMEIAVPDAVLKLVQASGRLLRREADRGTITVLDNRLITRRYGSAIVRSLPGYRQEIPAQL